MKGIYFITCYLIIKLPGIKMSVSTVQHTQAATAKRVDLKNNIFL